MQYPPETVRAATDTILERLAQGQSLRSICKDAALPSIDTVMRWLRDDDALQVQYARAKELGMESLADDILEIADNARNDWMERNGSDDPGWIANQEQVQRSRLRIDSRKWLMSKLAPRRYGERLDSTVTHLHQAANLSTADLQRIAAQALPALELDPDTGEVRGGG